MEKPGSSYRSYSPVLRNVGTASRIGRRSFLGALLSKGSIAELAQVSLPGVAGARGQPSLGAIRWDAWYAPSSSTTQAVIAALSPTQFHFRLPFFAEIAAGGQVFIDGGSQATIDCEIEQAHRGCIDYWAFVAYAPTSGMSEALHLYLSSTKKQLIRFCFFTELSSFGDGGELTSIVGSHIRLMADAQYMRVMDGRPLYYIGFFSESLISERWGGVNGLRQAIVEFRRRVHALGNGDPYIVLGDHSAFAARWAAQMGFDAIGAYATPGGGTHSYADLVAFAERRWEEEAATGLHIVPTVMTGWDPRPRTLTEQKKGGSDGPRTYYETAQPAEIAAHVQHALDWIEAHPSVTPANTGLIYAWNENDEGGWLVPTYPFDDSRLRAIRMVLCSWRTRHGFSSACHS